MEKIAIDARAGHPRPAPPDGFCWWVVVHQYSPGVRGRIPFQGPHQLPPDGAPEPVARRIWKSACTGEFKQLSQALERKIAGAP